MTLRCIVGYDKLTATEFGLAHRQPDELESAPAGPDQLPLHGRGGAGGEQFVVVAHSARRLVALGVTVVSRSPKNDVYTVWPR